MLDRCERADAPAAQLRRWRRGVRFTLTSGCRFDSAPLYSSPLRASPFPSPLCSSHAVAPLASRPPRGSQFAEDFRVALCRVPRRVVAQRQGRRIQFQHGVARRFRGTREAEEGQGGEHRRGAPEPHLGGRPDCGFKRGGIVRRPGCMHGGTGCLVEIFARTWSCRAVGADHGAG